MDDINNIFVDNSDSLNAEIASEIGVDLNINEKIFSNVEKTQESIRSLYENFKLSKSKYILPNTLINKIKSRNHADDHKINNNNMTKFLKEISLFSEDYYKKCIAPIIKYDNDEDKLNKISKLEKEKDEINKKYITIESKINITEKRKTKYSYLYELCNDCRSFNYDNLKSFKNDESNIYCFKCKKHTCFTKIEMIMYQINLNSDKSLVSSFISEYTKKNIRIKSFKIKKCTTNDKIIIFGLNNKFYFHKSNDNNCLISIDLLTEITNLEDLITFEEELFEGY
jgi:hypothetical protein